MNYLTADEVMELHTTSRSCGLAVCPACAIEALWSRLQRNPQMTFGGEDLYLTLGEKAAALGFSLIKNHPFADGNKRTGHAALETLLVRNGFELTASIDEQERIILELASGQLSREAFTKWVIGHMTPLSTSRDHE